MLYIDPEAYAKLLVKGCVKGKGTIIIVTNVIFVFLGFSSFLSSFRSIFITFVVVILVVTV